MKYKVVKQKNEDCTIPTVRQYDVKEVTMINFTAYSLGNIVFSGSLPECHAWIKLNEEGYLELN